MEENGSKLMKRKKPAIFVYPNLQTMAEIFAKFFLIRVEEIKRRNIERGEKTLIALGGGASCVELFNSMQQLVERGRFESIFRGCDLWWSDERYVDANSEQRNEKMITNFVEFAREYANYFPLPSTSQLGLVGDTEKLNEKFKKRYGERKHFDVVILGVGEDGHIASLFPGAKSSEEHFVAVENSSKPPKERISMSIKSIRSTDEVWLITSAAKKAEILARAFEALEKDEKTLDERENLEVGALPVSMALGSKRTIWFLDREAAAKINP
jgi:6-phosphogluconolactonase